MLLELFGTELTAAPCVCAGCGAREEVARLDVYVDCPGIVVRCRHCTDVMIAIVRGPEPEPGSTCAAPAASSCRFPSMRRRIERAILGILMSVVAFLVERRLVKALANKR